MIPSCFPWKVVIFFGKEHANWSSISGVMIGLSWKIKFRKINYPFGYYVNSKTKTPILSFPKLIFQLLPIITSLILDQLTWSLPKNVTTFPGQQDGIIIFVSVPIKGVFWQFEWCWAIEFGKVHYLFGKNINSKC